MSVSSKNIPINNKSLEENESFLFKKEKREASLEKPTRGFSLKNAFYKKDLEEKINKNLTILNYITNDIDRRYSAKTSLTNSPPEKFDYNLCMINKFDENLNTSLSFISDFDLEEEVNVKKNDSFNSCDNDGSCIEEIEIKTKINKISIVNLEKEEIDFEFEKEWKIIKESLLNKESKK